MDVLSLSATELAALVRAKKVSPSELVEAHIARIEAVNAAINAVVDRRYEKARQEALEAEKQLASRSAAGDLPPFHGVPCTIKEFLAVEGMSHTGGLLRRKGLVAKADAPTVARFRRAGAIVLGVTNGPEGGLWMESHNRVYGRTRNPWDLRRTSGGSSGGEAAIIAAGGSPFGLGSDIGGSIRTPSAFCGIVGHKPTGRMVPNTGQHPPVPGELSAFNAVGPMARRVADLMPVLRVIHGPDGVDPVTRPWELGDPDTVDLHDIVVYPLPWNGRIAVHASLVSALENAARSLEKRGARIGHIDPKRFRRAFEMWSARLGEVGQTYKDTLGDGEPIKLRRELWRLSRGRSEFTFPALMVATAEELARRLRIDPGDYARQSHALQAELESLLGPRGVILHPPYSRTAPLHHEPLLTPFDFVYAGVWNVMEFPVTVLPVGFDERHLPVSVQIAAARGRDHLTIAVARALEQELGGWVRAEPKAGPHHASWGQRMRELRAAYLPRHPA